MDISKIIIKPVITEKSSQLSEKLNKYTFVVNKKATKSQIKKAIELLYNVKVEKVNTLIQRGKRYLIYTKRGISKGRKPFYKKAIITLKEGYKIDLYSNI